MTTTTQPKFLKDPQSPVELAFTIEGKNFYQYVDPMNTPCQRGLAAIVAYDELRMRTTYKHLEAENKFMKEHFQLLRTSLDGSKGKITLSKAFDYINEMEKVVNYRIERMGIPIIEDLVYKLASVVFFTEEENPYQYDHEYNRLKIENWKKQESAYDFFLREPLRRLLPFSIDSGAISPVSLNTTLKAAAKLVEFQYGSLTGTPSK